MSALAKMYLWKNDNEGKMTPVKDATNLKINIVDDATGEFVIEGVEIGVFYQHMFVLKNKKEETEEAVNDKS